MPQQDQNPKPGQGQQGSQSEEEQRRQQQQQQEEERRRQQQGDPDMPGKGGRKNQDQEDRAGSAG